MASGFYSVTRSSLVHVRSRIAVLILDPREVKLLVIDNQIASLNSKNIEVTHGLSDPLISTVALAASESQGGQVRT